MPAVFSFLDEPKTALETLEELERIASREDIREIHLNHSETVKLGLCASVVMDQFLLEEDAKRPKGNKLWIGGTHSKNLDVRIMLQASGILRHLGHPEAELPPEIEQRIRRCSLFSGKASRTERSKERDIAGTKLVDYFNECLGTQLHALTPKGRRHLSALITEAIGNAEEHGGRWYTIGYFIDRTGEDEQAGECHIVLFNHGSTIYESLSAERSSESVKERARALAGQHTQRGWFRRPKWNEEALWTLYALQGGVSRFRDISPTRGNGTIEMIKVFSALAGKDQKMCIVSGSAYILFDGRYQLGSAQSTPTETQSVIAFNKENDLVFPPDPKYVFNLPFSFPGTLLSIRFNLERGHLAEIVERRNATAVDV
jgi:hypothetical protein